jgi:hypothetical protein
MDTNAKANVVTITLPAGMTEEQLLKVTQNYLPKKTAQRNRNLAKRHAQAQMIKLHEAEWKKTLNTEKARLGLKVS